MNVGNGLAVTYELLTTTNNDAAVAVLVAALDTPHRGVTEETLCALLRRRSSTGHREVLRRLDTMDDGLLAIVNEYRGRLGTVLRDAILGSDAHMCNNALQATLRFREYDLMSVLISAAEDESNPRARQAAETARELAGLLYEELAAPRDYSQRRDPQLVRRHLTTSLEQSVRRFSRHKRKELVEALVILATPDNATLGKMLDDPYGAVYLTLVDVLTHSERPGVMRLVLSFLEDERALSAMLSVVAHRSDSVFLSHLMARIGYEPPDAVVANLRRISSIPWIGGDMSVLDELSDSHQFSAVQMVMHSGVKRLEAFQVIRHLMLHGKSGGRRAASDALKQFNGNDANEIALSVIDDDDPVVQANVVAQVRQRGIPGALTRLIEKVSSPHEVVREAARESLGEFNFQRYLASFEMMDEEVRASTGALVRSVDPNSVPLLRNELGVKSRTRRLRAIAVAAAIGAVEELETSLIERLDDEDHMVRAEAARVLAGCKTENARDALRSLLGDTSVIVQEAAERSLSLLSEALNQPEETEPDVLPMIAADESFAPETADPDVDTGASK